MLPRLVTLQLLTFIGRIDGEAFEGGTAEGHSLEIGSNSFIPGFEDGLIGAKQGETLDVSVPFPGRLSGGTFGRKASCFRSENK